MSNIDDYTIGCICAVPTEAVALRLFLDEEYECPDILSSHASTQDHNVYTTGAMGGHKVVVASLPLGKYGVSQATSVISDMVRSFPNLRCCLMVGIGGGAPSSQNDIRLGDVVVSVPVDRSAGTPQYDHGKAIQGQKFRVTQHLNEPPRCLLSAVGKLAQDYEIEEHPLQDMINDVLGKRPRLKAKYQRPADKSDRLYKPSVVHQPDVHGNCEQVCGVEASKLVERIPRASGVGVTEIHHGTIASGSSLMKDAVVRDRLNEEEGVLCFEMEAAGLVNQFPCLVVRGICDYSDSHKNDEWQGYAAMIAAAYTKEILRVLLPRKVSLVERVVDRLGAKLTGIEENIQKLAIFHRDTQDDDVRRTVLDWLPSTDYTDRQNALQRERHGGTGQWFLDTSDFQMWLQRKGGILYCPGMPGAGKTHIASLAIYYLQSSKPFHSTPGLAYIYCEYTHQLTRDTLLGSLLEQLARVLHPLPNQLITLHENHKSNRTQPSVNELQKVLQEIASSSERCFIIVDGLDECANDEGMRSFFLETLAELQQSSDANILIMSRDIQHIENYFQAENRLQIEIKAPDDDIRKYLDHRIPRVLPFLASNPALCRNMKAAIMEAAGGMFLLAMLHVTSLRGKTNVKAIENALAELKTSGSSLIGAYDKTMKMIESQEEGYRRLAKEALSWVAFSSKPLRARQLQHALAIESGKQDLDPANLTELDIIISACAGLITMQRGRGWITVHLVHETTREYLDKTREKWFGNLRPRLARLCLTYLNFETFGSGPCAMNNELVAKLKQYPLYEYLGQTFMEYIEGNEDDVRVKTMLEKFFFSDMHVQTHLQSLSETPWYSAGWTSLHIAVVYRIGIIIPLLIPKWANKQNKNGLTPLHLAVLRRFYEGINSLVSAAQVDCNATTPWKRTALSYACELGDEISIRLLLACNRVDINLADERGRTPISCALEKGLMVAVHLLLERRDVDCVRPDCKGLVPLCYAALSGSEVCIQKLLERSDVNINTKLNNQITILHWAVYKSAMSTFEYILGKSGLNVNIGDHLGRTPLIWCIAHRARKMARLLLSRADVELSTVDNNGQGLLIWGIKYGWPDLLKELLTKLGSQLLVKDKFHLNALDYAAQYGRWHIIEQLLERYRPRICIEHRFAGVALHQAIKNGLPKFTKLLLERTEIESWWAICALLVSMENDTLECFMILREKLHAWMHHHPEWMIACLLRAATTGSDDVLRFMLKVSRGNTSGMQMEQVQLLNDQTWDEIDIRHALIEMPLTQVDIRDRLGQTALHSAARRGDYAASRILLMLGAGRSVRDIAGRTVLERAGKCQGSSWAAKERLEPSLQEPEPRDGG